MANRFIIKFDNRNQERIALDKLHEKVGDSVVHSGDKYGITKAQKDKLENSNCKFVLLKEV